MLEITPGLLFVAVIVIVTLLPLLTVPRSQKTVPASSSSQVPAVGRRETNVVLRWRTCDISTAGASPGPAFVTTVV